ncbi:uncharacterized protein METZ01_LOCUS486630, partial [marine metagenome]
VRKRLLIFCCVFFGIALGLALAFRSPHVRQNIRQQIMQQASAALDRNVIIGELELGVFPPTIELGSISVRDENGKPWIKLHRAKVKVQPWPSASMGLVIDLIELDGLDATITQAHIDALTKDITDDDDSQVEED